MRKILEVEIAQERDRYSGGHENVDAIVPQRSQHEVRGREQASMQVS